MYPEHQPKGRSKVHEDSSVLLSACNRTPHTTKHFTSAPRTAAPMTNSAAITAPSTSPSLTGHGRDYVRKIPAYMSPTPTCNPENGCTCALWLREQTHRFMWATRRNPAC